MRKRVVRRTGVRPPRAAEPQLSDQTSSPPAPTATERPGAAKARFILATSVRARAISRAYAGAATHSRQSPGTAPRCEPPHAVATARIVSPTASGLRTRLGRTKTERPAEREEAGHDRGRLDQDPWR